jgi:hypothetical protein
LKVAGEIQYWKEGKCMVFDDTFTRDLFLSRFSYSIQLCCFKQFGLFFVDSAVNDSDQTRVVLLLDFMLNPPDPDAPKHPKDQSTYLNNLTAAYGYEQI